MNGRIKGTFIIIGMLLSQLATPLIAAEPLSIQVTMPALACGKDGLEPNECILHGTLKLRGAETLNGSVRYYCDIRYSYVAAENANQAIKFNGRIIHHGEASAVLGRAQKELAEPLTLKLSSHARQIEIAEIGCEQE